MTTLMAASNQWASRPADQRFSSLADLHAATSHFRAIAAESQHVNPATFVARVGTVSESGEVRTLKPGETLGEGQTAEPVLVGESGVPAAFTHHSFGQFARTVEAPAKYLRTLPAPLAVANLNHGLNAMPEGTPETSKLLWARNGGLRLRAITGDGYTRIWNSDITARLIRLTEQSPEWQPAPAAFDGSRGLYASDADMFAFLVDNDRRIFERGPGGGLGRGFFVSNSEVGDKSFSVTTFWYEFICGNHRVWGVKGVFEVRIPHVGNADERAFRQLNAELRRYANASAADDEAKVAALHRFQLGGTKDEVLDKVFGLKAGLSRRVIGQAYAVAVENEDRYGDPHSAWGFTGGLTQVARDLPNTNDRVELEKAAGKIMQIAF